MKWYFDSFQLFYSRILRITDLKQNHFLMLFKFDHCIFRSSYLYVWYWHEKNCIWSRTLNVILLVFWASMPLLFRKIFFFLWYRRNNWNFQHILKNCVRLLSKYIQQNLLSTVHNFNILFYSLGNENFLFSRMSRMTLSLSIAIQIGIVYLCCLIQNNKIIKLNLGPWNRIQQIAEYC